MLAETPVRTANRVITAVLGLAAAAAWVFTVLQARARYAVPIAYLACAITLTAVACYGWLLVWLADRRDRETRCRHCGYILRGLREPRCPECGEPV